MSWKNGWSLDLGPRHETMRQAIWPLEGARNMNELLRLMLSSGTRSGKTLWKQTKFLNLNKIELFSNIKVIEIYWNSQSYFFKQKLATVPDETTWVLFSNPWGKRKAEESVNGNGKCPGQKDVFFWARQKKKQKTIAFCWRSLTSFFIKHLWMISCL